VRAKRLCGGSLYTELHRGIPWFDSFRSIIRSVSVISGLAGAPRIHIR
jgi:hypothetical protein